MIKKKKNTIWSWWIGMCVLVFVNVSLGILLVAYAFQCQNKNAKSSVILVAILAFIYIIVCGFRSVLPRQDVERICLIKTPLSTPFVGRSLATIAEMAYVILIAICMVTLVKLSLKKNNYQTIWNTILYLGVIMIFMAEIFSWIGCLSECTLWNALEESLWGIYGITLFALFIHLSFTKATKYIVYPGLIASALYVIYMFATDVPMYFKRYYGRKCSQKLTLHNVLNDMKMKFKEMKKNGLSNCIKKMNNCDKISNKMSDWKDDLPWFTGYFSLAVWSSIALSAWYTHKKCAK